MASGEAVKRIECHVDTVYCISFNYDGSLLATVSKDKKIRVIDPREGVVRYVSTQFSVLTVSVNSVQVMVGLLSFTDCV